MADYEGGLEGNSFFFYLFSLSRVFNSLFIVCFLFIFLASKTRRRKPVERLSESPIFPRKQKRDSSLSPSGKGRKRALEDPIENLDTKRVKYSHNYDDEEEEDENEDEITFQDSILKNRDPTKSTRRTITEAFSATGITPSNNSSTDSLLRQILARLELLKQQHKETERQIQYIIEESETNPDLFIIQQAKISQTETERNATLSGELLFNLKAFSSLLQRD